MGRLHSIRWRLLIAVNTAIGLPFLVFLAVDYRREMGARVAEKHIALEEEAKTLLPAVVRIRPQGLESLHQYIDDVCGRMQDASSPGHHIVVRLGEMVLQAVAHHRSSRELWEAIDRASSSPTHRAAFDDEEVIVGAQQQGDVHAYVSEYFSDVRRSLRRQVLWRLGRMLSVAVVVAAVVNLVFLQMASKPLEKLVETVRRIAAGELGAQTGSFRTAEAAYLAEVINSMSSSLAEADRHRRAEMAQARRIQEHLLPGEVSIPGLKLAPWYQPAAEVAGDYYDVVALPDGGWLIALADVTGHGIPAAMGAVMLKTLLLSAAERSGDPGQILGLMNRRFVGLLPAELFASMVLLRWDLKKRLLEYASAGHEPGWLVSADGQPRAIQATGMLLGVEEDATWETLTFSVKAGDRLLLVTDGVTEALSPRAEMFGRDRLAELFLQTRDAALTGLVSMILRAWDAHLEGAEPADDATLLAAEWVADQKTD